MDIQYTVGNLLQNKRADFAVDTQQRILQYQEIFWNWQKLSVNSPSVAFESIWRLSQPVFC